jgi:hypothetical protein
MLRRCAPVALLVLAAAAPLPAQNPPQPPTHEALLAQFAAREAAVPMRDGVALHTVIVEPRAASEPLPIVLLRTPYGADRWKRHFESYLRELAIEGYVFAFQDIRGRYRSEGTFVMQRPLADAGDGKGVDEGSDAYDTIDWLVHNVERTNGRVGMLGISYDGWTTIMAAVRPHPALRAISPQASPADMWLGDDFHHNGAFRLSYGFEYAAMMETTKEHAPFEFDRYDVFDWYLRLGSLKNVNERFLHERIPTWNDYVAHPDYDAFWQRQTVIPHLQSATVPTLNVAGWWDQEDFFGPLAIYRALEQHDPQDINVLVVGPWNHGGWSRGPGDRLGAIEFGSPTGAYFREQVQAPWFAHWLKDKGRLELPEALTFETGANAWRRWDTWPPRQAAVQKLYLREGGALSFAPPPAEPAFAHDAFVSDPAHPVPYRHRPIQATYSPGSKWRDWLVEDQRFVKDRADVLTWETAVLEHDVTIAGAVTVRLFASTTGTDADWIVKLIDVHPEEHPQDWSLAGYCLMVGSEVFRGRYWKGFTKPEPLPADEPVEFAWSLHGQNHTFRKGHRIMVQVQSTWFPLIDRNPQTFVPNILLAADGDFRAQTHRVFRAARRASCLELPVVGNGEVR